MFQGLWYARTESLWRRPFASWLAWPAQSQQKSSWSNFWRKMPGHVIQQRMMAPSVSSLITQPLQPTTVPLQRLVSLWKHNYNEHESIHILLHCVWGMDCSSLGSITESTSDVIVMGTNANGIQRWWIQWDDRLPSLDSKWVQVHGGCSGDLDGHTVRSYSCNGDWLCCYRILSLQ